MSQRNGENCQAFMEYSPSDDDLLSTEEAELYDGLLRITRILGHKQDTDEVLQALCREARSLFDADLAQIWIVEAAQETLQLRCADGRDRSRAWETLGTQLRLDDPESVVAQAARATRAERLHHLGERPSDKIGPPFTETSDLRSAIVVPLVEEDATFGVLLIADGSSPERFRPVDAARARLMAGQAVQAVVRAQEHQAMREAEARYRGLFNHVPIGLFRSTPDGTFLDVNPALVQILGYPDRETLLATPAAALYPDPGTREQRRTQVERDGVIVGHEMPVLRHDGERVWVREQARAIRDEEGNTVCYEGSLEDVTEAKQRQEALEETTHQLNQLFENIDELFYSIDVVNYRPIQISPKHELLYGYPNRTFYEDPDLWWKIIHPADREAVVARVYEAMGRGESLSHEYRIVRGDGEVRWVEARMSPTLDEEGTLVRIDGLVYDITDRKEADESLHMGEEKYRTLFEQTHDAVYILDPDGWVTDINRAMLDLLAIGHDEIIGRHAEDVFDIDRDDRKRIQHDLEHKGYATDVDVRLTRQDGIKLDCRVSISPRLGGEGDVLGYHGIIRDVTAQKRLESRLIRLADRDPLTDLLNRRRFEDDLQHHLAQAHRSEAASALLWIDIDHFKAINDSLGHRAGDELLVALSDLLQENLREQDLVARIGGDEFIVLLPQTTAARAEMATQKLLRTIENREITVNDQTLQATVSIGIALFPEHGRTAEDLLARVDTAMYQAKRQGRNRYCLYDPHSID